jgi:hypothetical protein
MDHHLSKRGVSRQASQLSLRANKTVDTQMGQFGYPARQHPDFS